MKIQTTAYICAIPNENNDRGYSFEILSYKPITDSDDPFWARYTLLHTLPIDLDLPLMEYSPLEGKLHVAKLQEKKALAELEKCQQRIKDLQALPAPGSITLVDGDPNDEVSF